MFDALLAKALDHVSITESMVEMHDVYVGEQAIERQAITKVYAASSCVTRLYAIYENFIETILSDYLDSIPEIVAFADLEEGMRTEYRVGISHVLSRIDRERYSHLKHENVVAWYHEALSNLPTYRFVTEALTRHEANLRLEIVDVLMSRAALSGLRGWLIRSPLMLELYEEKTAIYEQLDSEINAFVQARNDAAHGDLETLEGKDNLLRYCRLVKAFLQALTAFVHRDLLLRREGAGRVRRIGRVTEVFNRPGVFIAQVGNGCRLQVGMELHFLGRNYCHVEHVQTLQVEGVSVEVLVADREDFEVGVKCPSNQKINAGIYVEAVQ